MRFVERGDLLHVTRRSRKLFDRAAYEALDSGFTSTVLIRMWIYPRDSTDPVAFIADQPAGALQPVGRGLRAASSTSPAGTQGRQGEAQGRGAEAADQRSTTSPSRGSPTLPYEQDLPARDGGRAQPGRRRRRSPQVRRWLSQGNGGGLDRGGAFFGSFVSVFVNPKIPEADRVLRIRSQPFYGHAHEQARTATLAAASSSTLAARAVGDAAARGRVPARRSARRDRGERRGERCVAARRRRWRRRSHRYHELVNVTKRVHGEIGRAPREAAADLAALDPRQRPDGDHRGSDAGRAARARDPARGRHASSPRSRSRRPVRSGATRSSINRCAQTARRCG